MKTACVTIVYHPDEKVLTNLLVYESFPDSVYVIDNTDGPQDAIALAISKLSYIKYFRDGVNRGLSSRLNQACTMALLEGFEWILTMDQDSFFDPGLLRRYLSCAAAFPGKEDVALFGVGYGEKISPSEICKAAEIGKIITSGTILNLPLFQQIGPFDESLFIDGVDLDYCLKARSCGYKLICFDNIVLDHRIGLISQHRSFKTGVMTSRSLHSPIRLYYMTRNYLYLSRKYKGAFPLELDEHRRNLIQRIKNNLFYNRKRVIVLRYVIKGAWDYYTGRMNKLA